MADDYVDPEVVAREMETHTSVDQSEVDELEREIRKRMTEQPKYSPMMRVLDERAARATKVVEFETRDSGKREEYASGMRRDTQEGKPRWDLLFAPDMPYEAQPLHRVASLMQRGAEKYGDANWALADSAEELARFRASAARHFAQWMAGETDEDHMAAVWFNLQAHAYVEWKLSMQRVQDEVNRTRENLAEALGLTRGGK